MNNPADFSLALGYYATLTGETRCDRLEIIANSFELFCIESRIKFKNWVEAWNQFYKA